MPAVASAEAARAEGPSTAGTKKRLAKEGGRMPSESTGRVALKAGGGRGGAVICSGWRTALKTPLRAVGLSRKGQVIERL